MVCHWVLGTLQSLATLWARFESLGDALNQVALALPTYAADATNMRGVTIDERFTPRVSDPHAVRQHLVLTIIMCGLLQGDFYRHVRLAASASPE